MKRSSNRSRWVSVAQAAVLLASGATNSFSAPTVDKKHQPDTQWLGTWASSPQAAESIEEFADMSLLQGLTLRQIVHISIGGQTVRVRFSNEFGKETLRISAAHIAKTATPGAIQPGSDKALTFRGQSSATIPAGALIYSDPLDFELTPLSNVTVTIYLKNFPNAVTTHSGARTTSYIAVGDKASDVALSGARTAEHWYFLNGIEVATGKPCCAVVTLGDSITDGKNSTTSGNTRWPDDLAARLQHEMRTRHIAVLNEGIGGNRLLHDGLGPNALARLDRDVLAQIGVRWLVVFEGVNDIGTCKDACDMNTLVGEMTAAYEQIILRAHAHNIRVYGATITPFGGSFYDTPAGEHARQSVNDWIRTSGRFDAILDFDAVTRDPSDPSNLRPAFDSGDHLHPTDAGYKAIADSVDLNLFRNK
jgi:lysophospholipase L1-like esterase